MKSKNAMEDELEFLRKENRILKALQESSVDGILVVDENARIISCNERFLEMMNVPSSVPIKGHDLPLLNHLTTQVAEPDAFLARVSELYEDKLATGHDEILLANGSIYERYTSPMYGPDNSYYGRVWYFHDVTEIRRSEKSLRSSEERFRAISEYSFNSICILNTSGKVTWVNDAMIDLAGYTRKQVYEANSFVNFLAPESIDFVVSNFMKFANKETYLHHYQFFLIRADGEKRLCEKFMSHYEDQNGDLNLIISMIDVTEINKAEKRLRQREEDLNHAQEIARMGSWELNFITGEYTWSRNNYLLIGLKPFETEVTVEYFMKMMHPDDLPLLDELIARVTTEKVASSADLRIILPDGTISWIENNVVPVINGDVLTGIKGVNIDITEKKHNLEKIRQQNERLHAIISAMPDLIFVIDQNGTYKEVYCSNPEQLVIKPELIIGSNVKNGFAKDMAGMHFQNIKNCIDHQKLVSYDYTIGSNGHTQVFEARLVPFGVGQVLALVRNITESKQKDSDLRKLSLAVEQSPVIIEIISLDGTIEYINPAFCKTTGYSRKEIIGKNTNLLKSGKNNPALYKELWQTIRDGKKWSGEWINRKKSGEYYWESISITPVLNETGKISNYLAVKQDISGRKKTEQEILDLNASLERKINERTTQLAEMNQYLLTEIERRKCIEQELLEAITVAEKANLAKSEFLSRMSHELRTPMNAILGYAQLLAMGELSPVYKKGVNHILKSGKHLLELINEVLDLAGIEAGRVRMVIEPVNLAGLFSELEDLIHPLTRAKDIMVTFLPLATGKVYVLSDRHKLTQVMLNLLNNAIKYNHPEGSVVVQTDMIKGASGVEETIRISVTDNGIGISAEDLPKLFNPFERLGAEKTLTEGNGLGLAVVKKIVTELKGSYGVTSKLGVGSTFWIELPLSKNATTGKPDLRTSDNPAPEKKENAGTVLYIEDNISNIELVEQILSEHRSNVKLICNMYGLNAVKLAVEHRPELILLDLQLPDIHGSDVLRLLHEETSTREIPVVIISADAMPDQRKSLQLSGASNYFSKPLDVHEFLAEIDKWTT